VRDAGAREAGRAGVIRRKETSVAKPAAKKATRKTIRVSAPKSAPASTAAEPKEPRKLTKAQLIDEINKDLAKEYSALIQYVQHASVITGPQYDTISAELTVHSNEEHQHAITLSDQIDFLGGVPDVNVADIHISPDSKIMLEQDLEGELDAIARYRERIGQAEILQEYGLRRALEDILIIEEEHARDLQSALDL
jgi:bacterioferritin